MIPRLRRLVVPLVAVLAAVVVAPAAAYAAPANDDFAAATVIGSLPYTTTQDTSDATSDPGDPTYCYNNGSVWFSYTASSDGLVLANTFGSGYDTVLSAYTGSQGALNGLACNDDYNGLQSQISFGVTAGTTYYIMVAFCCSYGGTGGGSLQFSADLLEAAGNDNFADATAISGVPYSASLDLSTASAEAGEPSACFTPEHTVWYSYTATTTESLMARTDQYYTALAVYTGTTLSSLSQVSCGSESTAFRAQAGTTYYIQVGSSYQPGITQFHLDVAPNPTASFSYYPYEPSSYDSVTFYSYSSDPAGAGISSLAWNFGDGTTATGDYVTHRYATDGDYTVTLTVTTTDGRTGSASQILHVRTHDVSIVRLNTPATAHLGQTIGINVYVKNTRYEEQVNVTLYRSQPSGYAQVGSSTQTVVVSTTGQTTRFSFNYTISSSDLAVGKITFKATATIVGHEDAFTADNELVSSPVKLSA